MSENDVSHAGRSGLEVAIIGMAGRFPGARDVGQLWESLRAGAEAVTFLSDEELLQEGVDPALLADPGYVKAAVLLEETDLFDAAFFEIPPREAETIDPQQRLFLECGWQALEKAGYAGTGCSVGVFAGSTHNSYLLHNLLGNPGAMAAVGTYALSLASEKDFLSTRLSYKLGLEGPSLTVQTACSTSLVAVHLACQSLLAGECDLALAGGVAVRALQKIGYLYQPGGISSPDGHCRAFDARAQGMIGGQGVGIVVLKLLESALADGDHVHAVIKGTAINNDGALKAGFTAPRRDGQARVIRAAQLRAEVDADSIGYVEAHGTGTPLGDPIEVAALTRAFRAGTGRRGFCAIGSVKTNIGHLDAAAGVTGLIKTALVLEHREIPPSLHFETPNPEIDFAASPFYVNDRLRAWPSTGAPRRAAVSSFGIGGTNAHAILEEAPEAEPSGPSRPWQLLLLSARSAPALEEGTRRLASFLAQAPDTSLPDVAYTLQVGRKAFEHRRMLVCSQVRDALDVLEGREAERLLSSHREPARRPVAFLFPGQGAQHAGMGRGLYATEEVFRREVDLCARLLLPHLGRDLREIFTSGEELRETRIAQPALFVVEYALARLLSAWGIRPWAMIGHSVGEYVAACLAGVFSLEDALALVAARGELLQSLPGGAMLSVELSAAELDPLLGTAPGLSIAAINAPGLCVVSGPEPALADFEAGLQERGTASRRLRTSHAFHSAMMDPVLAAFAERVARTPRREPQIPYLSNRSGDWVTPAEATDPACWVRHLRDTVRFGDGIARLLAEPAAILLEVGPGGVLGGLARRQIAAGSDHAVIAAMRHPGSAEPDQAVLLRALGRLWLAGAEIDWPAFQQGERRRRVELPTYAFQRRRYWIEPSHRRAAPEDLPAAPDAASALPSAAGHARPDLTTPYEAPRNELERRIAAVWERLLGVEGLGIHDDFFELGGQSLLAVRLLSHLREELEAELPVEALFEAPTIARLSVRVAAAQGATGPTGPPILPVKRTGVLPLSFAQERFWILDRLLPGSPAYNLQVALRLGGRLDTAALQSALTEVVRRHEILRTSYPSPEGLPEQRIDPPSPVPLGVVDLRPLPEAQREVEALRLAEAEARLPFDLAHGPVLRTRLLALGGREHVLLLGLHHIAADGWSIGLLTEELALLYGALRAGRPAQLAPPPLQYADYAAWQRTRLAGEPLDSLLAYWRTALAGAPESLDLPFDRPRPAAPTRLGAAVLTLVPSRLAESLRATARSRGGTLFIALLAGLAGVLHRWSGQGDLVIGTVSANRQRRETERLLGCFVNFLPLRVALAPAGTWREAFDAAREAFLGAQAHQECPFEKIVAATGAARDAGGNPLYDVALLLQNLPPAPAFDDGLEVRWLPQPDGAALLDLRLIADEVENGLRLRWEYSTDLFDRATIERLAEAFEAALGVLAGAADQELAGFALPPALAGQALESRSRSRERTITLAATFTAEPVERALRFWLEEVDLPARIVFAPYGQVFQELLNPAGLFARNRKGVNVALVRIEDWKRDDAAQSAADLLRALRAAAASSATPLLLCLCPCAADDEELRGLEESLAREAEEIPGVHVVRSAELARLYPVAEPFDPHADALGHIPYTPALFTALGTLLARRIHGLETPPYKVIALDCDQTLWKGVCGEDGPFGIEIDPPRRALQELMVARHAAGMLLCLCSKNNPEDVREVFARRPEMPLRWEHFTAHRLNWSSKAENLRSLAAELGLGLDSFVFVDDNPVECAEVQAACPEVLTVELPEPEQIPRFLHHVWAFDRLRITEDDRRRAEVYRQNRERERLRETSFSLAEFLADLRLEVDLLPLTPECLPRAAQLTQRTNQLNLTTIRRSEAELAALCASGAREGRVIAVRDRFGEYGLVGLLLFSGDREALDVETFLLSCRVLGRGVERRVLAELGRLAHARGLRRIELRFVPTAKNRPALEFLEAVASPGRGHTAAETIYTLPVGEGILHV